MKNTLLQTKINDLIMDPIVNQDAASISIWLYVAILEFGIIGFLLWRLRKKPKNLDFSDVSKKDFRKAKKADINMNHLMNNINQSRDLYKDLSRSCHPDRFINSDKQTLAQEIFQDISHHKRDFQKLMELKKRAEKELDINFE